MQRDRASCRVTSPRCARGTPQNPEYGLGLWLGEPYLQWRAFANASRPGTCIVQFTPYLAHDVFSFDGNGSQVMWMIPLANMVVPCTGNAPPPSPEWDNAFPPNTRLASLKAATSK